MKIRKWFTLVVALGVVGMSPAAEVGAVDAAPAAMAGQEAVAHPFFRTRGYPAWSAMTAEQAVADARAAIEQARARLEALSRVSLEEATFENTFLAYYEAEENLQQLQLFLYHLMHTVGDPELQKAYAQVVEMVAEFEATRPGTEEIQELLLKAAELPCMQALSPVKRHFIDKILLRLRLNGGGLTPEKRARLAEVNQQLKEQAMLYTANLEAGAGDWHLVITDAAELDGMSAGFMERASKAAQARGVCKEGEQAWVVNLSDAHAGEVLRHCTVAETRRKCWYGTNAVGTAYAADNEPVIHKILALRQEQAELCGYRHFADMKAAALMMGTGEKALAFVDEMLQKSKPAYDAWVRGELARLSAAAGCPLEELAPWDEAFYARTAPAGPAGFDAGQLTPYFEAEAVIQGLMRLCERVYGVRVEEAETDCPAPGMACAAGKVEVWHPSVRVFRVYDAATGEHLGNGYLDLYPREGKRWMAWCMPLQFGDPGEPNLACVVTNLTPPPAEGQAHLLHHGDLFALFHECGHLIHMLLSHGELRGVSAMDVESDFIEMPSQFQENWIWEPATLATFAVHHETGEPLPQELARQLAESRNKASVVIHMRMLCAAKLDLEMHMHYKERFEGRALDAVAAEILRPWQFPYTTPYPCEMRNFIYCMTESYAASFYTYKWSEVLAADAFTRFQAEGVLNPATGAEYRKEILSRGGSAPAIQLFRNFMGRGPNTDALKIYTHGADE